MASRVLLGIADQELAGEIRALINELGTIEVVRAVSTRDELLAACREHEIDVILLHEQLGPLPVLALTQDLVSQFPALNVVLLVAEPSAELLQGALTSGARGMVQLPATMDALEANVTAAASWSQRTRMGIQSANDDATSTQVGARMVVVGGAKGGVGTTSIALHLALEGAEQLAPRRTVCFVDFDLQTGDAGIMLDLEHRRSVLDLLQVAEDLSVRHLDEALYRHASGLHMLLAPGEGEYAEDVTGTAARQILSAIRGHFDVVVVDIGSTTTEASAVATELADAVVIVTTPDVPSMRGANRLIQLWERIDARKDDIHVLVNRTSKQSDVQPELVRSVVGAPVLPTTIGSDFPSLQVAINAAQPARASETPFRTSIHQLGAHLGLWPREKQQQGRRRFWSGDDGQGAVEFVGVLPLMLVVLMLAIQLGLAGFTFLVAGHAATESANLLSVGGSVGSVSSEVADRLPSRWAGSLELSDGGAAGARREVAASVRIPMIIPGISPDVRVTSTSGYVDEDSAGRLTP